jgi:hypothetical protein
MPTVNVEDNIIQLRSTIEKMTQEVFRAQGMLSTFEGFKKGGLETIDLPDNPNQPVKEPVKEPNNQPHTGVSGSEMLSTIMANPSLMAAVMSAMTNTTSSGNVPNQPPSDEQVESVQEKPE